MAITSIPYDSPQARWSREYDRAEMRLYGVAAALPRIPLCELLRMDVAGNTHGIRLEDLYREHLLVCATCRDYLGAHPERRR